MSDVNRFCSRVYFPEELIVNILKRLPVKCLLRFTSVCKHWYSLIKNPNFISSHVDHLSNEGPNYLMYREDYDDYRVYEENDDFERHLEFRNPGFFPIVGCCNGVICFDCCSDSSIVLWNPTLRKSLKINVPHCKDRDKESDALWFGFDVASNDYKVVWVGYSTNDVFETRLFGVYIYSLNERVWRHVDTSFMLYDGQGYVIGYRGEYLNGVIHWVAQTYYNDRDMPEWILTFNLADETFGKFRLPRQIAYVEMLFDGNMSIEEYFRVPHPDDIVDLMVVKRGFENCLMVLHEDLTSLNIWVIKEGVVRSWRKELYLSKGFYKKILNVTTNGDIVVQLDTGDVVSCDHRPNGRLIYISSEEMKFVGTYVESLVLL